MQDNAGQNKEKRQKVRTMQDNAGQKSKVRTMQDNAGQWPPCATYYLEPEQRGKFWLYIIRGL